MLMRQRALPKYLGVFLVAATIHGALPQAPNAAPVKAAAHETVEVKGSKKRKKPLPEPTRFAAARSATASPWDDEPQTAAEIAVDAALEQVGKPYRWGAVGPGSFDCSGLTRYAWGEAGVDLPHSSRGQYGSLEHIDQNDLRPGDLVYTPGHIGLYIGDGKMVHSPHSGARVQIAPLRGHARGSRPA